MPTNWKPREKRETLRSLHATQRDGGSNPIGCKKGYGEEIFSYKKRGFKAVQFRRKID